MSMQTNGGQGRFRSVFSGMGRGLGIVYDRLTKCETYRAMKALDEVLSIDQQIAYHNMRHGARNAGGGGGAQQANAHAAAGQTINIYAHPQQATESAYGQFQDNQAYLAARDQARQDAAAQADANAQMLQSLENMLYHTQQTNDANAALITRSYEAMEKVFQDALREVKSTSEAGKADLVKIIQDYQRNLDEHQSRLYGVVDRLMDQPDKLAKSLSKVSEGYGKTQQQVKDLKSEYKKDLQIVKLQSELAAKDAAIKLLKDYAPKPAQPARKPAGARKKRRTQYQVLREELENLKAKHSGLEKEFADYKKDHG